MKTVLVVCVLLSISAAAPIEEDAQAKILKYENENDGQGNYEFSFQTSNGIERKETGRVVNVGQPDEHIEVRGFYSFLDPEGNLLTVNYIADENGYRIDSDQPIKEIFTMTPFGVPAAALATLLG